MMKFKNLLPIFIFLFLITSCSKSVTNTDGGARPCGVKDFTVSSNEMLINEDILQGFSLTNSSDQLCMISTLPNISLIDADGSEFTNKDVSLSLTSNSATDLLIEKSASVILSVRWQHICTPNGGMPSLKLTLGDGALTLPPIQSQTRICSNQSTKPNIVIRPFTFPP